MIPKTPGERYLVLVLFAMFLIGIGMLYQEIVKWRRKQRDLYGETGDRFSLSERLRSIRGRLQPAVKSTDDEQKEKAA